MFILLLKRILVLLLVTFTITGGNPMASAEIEKKLYAGIAKGLLVAPVTASDKALAKAYQEASDAIVIPPPVVVPPVVTPPVSTAWPKDLTANPTGPKKALPARVANLTITEDNKIVDGYNADVVLIKANNVTLKNGATRSIQKDPGKTGLVIEDSKIDGENQSENAVQWSDYTCRRTEITRTTDAFKAHGNVTIEDCWIHDLNFQTGAGTGAGGFSHNDGIQVSSGSKVTTKNSRFENMRGNAGVFIDSDQGPISDIIIQNNFLNNVGNYMIYVKPSANANAIQFGKPTNITIVGNIFGKRPDYLDPNWGEMKAEINANNLVWQNNKNVEGKAVTLDNYGKAITQT